jgi:peptidoglycan hydrolase-like protein with peptidoglycan-binding domain
MSRDIYTEANLHFLQSGRQYEYGRPDMSLGNQGGNRHTDRSRTEQDADHDGRLGVDCSAFVWRGLHDAGYAVPAQPFNTHDLFDGRQTTSYARQHFDVVPAGNARAPHGSLEPGDILMFRNSHGSGQHVGIFKGYDAQGNIQFIGSQVSTGPAEVTIRPGGYWDGHDMEIVGALRAKPEFRAREALHAQSAATPTPTTASAPAPNHREGAAPTPAHANPLHQGDKGQEVRALQDSLNRIGSSDERGRPVSVDGDYGTHTKAAVERFQRSHGLEVDGVAGPRTMEAIRHASPRLDGQAHPDHALFTQARDAVHRLDAEQRRAPDQYSERMAAALTVAARSEGLHRVDHAALNTDASTVYAVQGEPNSPFKRVAEVSTQQAANTSIEESSRQWQQVTEQQQVDARRQSTETPHVSAAQPHAPSPSV